MANEMLKDNIERLISELNKITDTNIKGVMGLDGFVDQILHVVKTRTDAENYTRMDTLKDFGEFILRAAGLSANIEFIPLQSKLGGNGPIMSNALSTYGLDITDIGALGTPNIHPVFEPMSQKCNIISIANPGLTDAVEFLDGKLMIGKRECLKEVNWENLKNKVSIDELTTLFEEAKFVGLENWTMLTHMTSIWRGLISDVLPNLSKKDDKYGYIDKDGKVVVDYIYEEALDQNQYGFAAIKKDGLWGAIDANGKVVVDTKYNLDNNLLIDFIGKWHLGQDLNMNYYCEK